MKGIFTNLRRFFLLLAEYPAFLRQRAHLRKWKNAGNITISVEIQTTNEFFYLEPVLSELQKAKARIIFFCRPKLRRALAELVNNFFSHCNPKMADIYFIHHMPEVDFYLNATLSYDIEVPERAKYKVNFPHTTTAKNDDIFSPAVGKMTDSFNSGPAYEADILDYCRKNAIKNIPRMHAIGVPRTDAFYKGAIDRKKFLESVGLDPTKKTVMYAPTWNQDASLFVWLENIMALPSKHNINLIVKVHPGMYIDPSNKKSSGGIDWKTFFDPGSLKDEGIINVYNEESINYVKISDYGITDMCTIWTEFYFTRKPIIFLDTPEYIKRRGFCSLGDYREKCGYIVKDPSMLDEMLAGLLSGEKYPHFAYDMDDQLAFNIGHATEAAVKNIKELYEKK